MALWAPTKERILSILADGKPRSHKEIMEVTGLSRSSIWNALRRYWERGLLLRSEKPIRVYHKRFRGRARFSANMRSYYLYMLRSEGVDSREINGQRFVAFKEKYIDTVA